MATTAISGTTANTSSTASSTSTSGTTSSNSVNTAALMQTLGAGSGIDTKTLAQNLVDAERAPQDRKSTRLNSSHT